MKVPFIKNISKLGIDIGRVISVTDSDHGSGDLVSKILRNRISEQCIISVKFLVNLFGRDNTFIVSKCGSKMQRASVVMLGLNDFYNRTGLDPKNVYFCFRRSGTTEYLNFKELRVPHYAKTSKELQGFGKNGAKVTDNRDVGKGAIALKLKLTHLIDDRDDCLISFYKEGYLSKLENPEKQGALIHFGPRAYYIDNKIIKKMWYKCDGNAHNEAWINVLNLFK